MPASVLRGGLAPFLRDRATYPLIGVMGLGIAYVGYNMGRHALYNPDVAVSKTYRKTSVDGDKWALKPGAKEWVADHVKKSPHVDYKVEDMRLLDFMSAKYWQQRREVKEHPELYTRTGRSASGLPAQ